jgi:Domain of unknown function (DUF1707)
MDDRMRASDADRDRATARLREHFAEGRLTQAELDERISAALSAKTLGDLRRVTADLPEPGVAPWGGPRPQPTGPPFIVARRHPPRLLPVILLVLLLALVIPHGGLVLLGVVNFFLLMWVFIALTGVLLAAWFRRRMRRAWQSGYGGHGDRPGPWR